MAKPPGPILTAWYNWKMLRFPWRKRWLVGFDLEGNTFWEFKDALHALRNRRTAKYSRKTHHGDVQVSPSWMQWLRHTRYDPPTIAEQRNDLLRQQHMKVLAAQADARWASKPSALDAPDKQQPLQMLKSRDPESGVRQMNATQEKLDAPVVREPESAVVEERPVEEQLVEERPVEKQVQPETPADEPAFKPRFPMKKEPKDSPWKQAHSGQSQDWQPKGWSPGPAKRR
ncbi:hypothetical protein P153DRAFT_395742 [Dothidotthia symphoricarpi CBS 119687]|uniref:Uncharacterized protein n=1 Tax=Dothidotthia symphoricarpi CBS 119687 TaxID=1392245 RepID=A0A6A6AFI0_9PLEO|nr:uncharacterized protein P153DRAFT_395742 [Dothidotthia symphoricarpi CBS 119687]KAF2130316.1 hypothetical protein P153DRAFT_395742 [Dothidotthia symphoricarpi CBS 119687]